MLRKPYIAALKSFMKAWKEEDYAKAAAFAQLTWRSVKKRNPDNALRDLLMSLTPHLLNYEIKGHKSISNVMKDVKIAIEYEAPGNIILHKTLVARVICEEAPFTPSIHGKWGVNPSSLFVKR